MKNNLFLILIIVLISGFLFADPDVIEKYDDSSSVAAKYLDLTIGAAGAGMGNAYIGLAKDASSIFWNPAGLSNMQRVSYDWNIFVSHNIWLMDTMADNISLAKKFNKIGVFGLGLIYFNSGTIEKYDIDENNKYVEKGTFTPYALTGILSYSNSMDKDIDFGINLKYILDNIDNSMLYTFSFDIGIRYFSPVKNLNFSIVAKNFGGRLGDFVLAKELSFATAYSFEINDFILNLDFDICGKINNNPVYRFGVEFKTPYLLILRTGYRTDNSLIKEGFKDINFGIGIDSDGKMIDISFEPYGELGNSLQISISGSL